VEINEGTPKKKKQGGRGGRGEERREGVKGERRKEGEKPKGREQSFRIGFRYYYSNTIVCVYHYPQHTIVQLLN